MSRYLIEPLDEQTDVIWVHFSMTQIVLVICLCVGLVVELIVGLDDLGAILELQLFNHIEMDDLLLNILEELFDLGGGSPDSM